MGILRATDPLLEAFQNFCGTVQHLLFRGDPFWGRSPQGIRNAHQHHITIRSDCIDMLLLSLVVLQMLIFYNDHFTGQYPYLFSFAHHKVDISAVSVTPLFDSYNLIFLPYYWTWNRGYMCYDFYSHD